MARTDNLTNFLTDVANAIRNKKGTSELIQASNFDTEIESIQSGGSGITVVKSNTSFANTNVTIKVGSSNIRILNENVNLPDDEFINQLKDSNGHLVLCDSGGNFIPYLSLAYDSSRIYVINLSDNSINANSGTHYYGYII